MSDKQVKVEKLIDQISQLSVLELSELVGALQEKFGVSAAHVVSDQSTLQASSEQKPQEAKTTATVVLTDAGANKIAVIKALREIKPELGLKETKDITDATPKEILTNVKMEEANLARQKLETAGGKVELK